MDPSRFHGEPRGALRALRIGGADNSDITYFIKSRMQRHREQGGTMLEPTADSMTDAQWAEYLSEVLNRLSAHADQLPTDATLRELIEATCEPLGLLLGYFAAGDAENSAQLDLR